MKSISVKMDIELYGTLPRSFKLLPSACIFLLLVSCYRSLTRLLKSLLFPSCSIAPVSMHGKVCPGKIVTSWHFEYSTMDH